MRRILRDVSMGWVSSVGIANRQGLDGAGIKFRWGQDFPQLSTPAVGPTQPPAQRVQFLFPGDKEVSAWR
jgi:hypothetical protein